MNLKLIIFFLNNLVLIFGVNTKFFIDMKILITKQRERNTTNKNHLHFKFSYTTILHKINKIQIYFNASSLYELE